MTVLNNIEKYALDLLTGKNDEIMEERINCFSKINSVFGDDGIDYLINAITESFIYNLRTNKYKVYKQLYENCLNLLEKNKIDQLNNVFIRIEKLNLPNIYKYFFDKIKIKLRLKEFNNKFPICEEELDDYPIRKEINNRFDLEEDINNLEDFLLKHCFDTCVFNEKNLTNKISKYYYLLKVLRYELEILPDIREMRKELYVNVLKIEKKIINSKKYNIPIRLKSGFT